MKNVCLDLFLTFSRVGALTFGGGYAMLPILQREVVEQRGWITERDMMDMYAIGQCLPGLIAVNTAIFTGHRVKGARGGLCAALGIVAPSLVIITVIAAFLGRFADVPAVQHAFAGVRICVLVLVAQALWKLRKAALVDWAAVAVFLAILAAGVLTPLSPALLVAAAGLAGFLLYGRTAWASFHPRGKGKEGKKEGGASNP